MCERKKKNLIKSKLINQHYPCSAKPFNGSIHIDLSLSQKETEVCAAPDLLSQSEASLSPSAEDTTWSSSKETKTKRTKENTEKKKKKKKKKKRRQRRKTKKKKKKKKERNR